MNGDRDRGIDGDTDKTTDKDKQRDSTRSENKDIGQNKDRNNPGGRDMDRYRHTQVQNQGPGIETRPNRENNRDMGMSRDGGSNRNREKE